MTDVETAAFIDCITWEECAVRLYGKTYLCLGLVRWPDHKIRIHVFEIDPASLVAGRDVLHYVSDSKDDCMRHFLEDRYWDGKSFYEVAPDMEWIDL